MSFDQTYLNVGTFRLPAVVAVSLAACGGSQALTGTNAAPSNVAVPDRTPIPPCKGQKNTKEYASIGAKTLSSNGGTLLRSEFWRLGRHDGLSRPYLVAFLDGTDQQHDGIRSGAFPPGSVNPIFYIQFKLNTYGVIFSAKLPVTGGLSSKFLTVGKPYTAQGASDVGSLWDALGVLHDGVFDQVRRDDPRNRLRLRKRAPGGSLIRRHQHSSGKTRHEQVLTRTRYSYFGAVYFSKNASVSASVSAIAARGPSR